MVGVVLTVPLHCNNVDLAAPTCPHCLPRHPGVKISNITHGTPLRKLLKVCRQKKIHIHLEALADLLPGTNSQQE